MTRGVGQRFRFLTSGFEVGEWLLLGAIALEYELVPTAFDLLAKEFNVRAPYREVGQHVGRAVAPVTRQSKPSDRLELWAEQGLLVRGLQRQSFFVGRSHVHEAAFAAEGEFRQLVLRELAAQGQIERIAQATRGLLGDKSVAALGVCIQRGDYERVGPTTAELLFRQSASPLTRRLDLALFDAVCRPFDAEWLERVWRDDAQRVAAQLLQESLPGLEDVAGLYEWSVAHLQGEQNSSSLGRGLNASTRPVGSGWERVHSERVLSEHALMRGHLEVVESRLGRVDLASQLAFSCMVAYQVGDLPAAQERVDQCLATLDENRPGSAAIALPGGSVAAPLMVLLLLARDDAVGKKAAKRISASRPGAGKSAFGKSLRVLIRYVELPKEECPRLDPHQLDASASAWDVLVLGLTALNYETSETVRTAWAESLLKRASGWLFSGYAWFARQALFVAHALDAPCVLAQESQLILGADFFRPRPGELLLRDILEPKAEWEKTLGALTELLDDQPEPGKVTERRVQWFFDGPSRSLTKPGLQELRVGKGWSVGRRVSLSTLKDEAEGLPEEDLRVLRTTREVEARGKLTREFTPASFEALIGHPRVAEAAPEKRPLSVIEKAPKIVAETRAGHFEVKLIPQISGAGVSVELKDEVLCVYRISKNVAVISERIAGGLRVPADHKAEVLGMLGRLSHTIEVDCPELGDEKDKVADSTPCLRIAPQLGNWFVEVGVRPFGQSGRFFYPGSGPASVSAFEGGLKVRMTRNFEQERQRSSQLVAVLHTLEHPEEESAVEHHWDLDQESLLDLLAELRDCGHSHEIEWPESNPIRMFSTLSTGSLSAQLRRDKHWYLASGRINVDDTLELELGELAELEQHSQGRFVRLPTGDYVEIERRVRRVLRALAGAQPVGRGRKKGLRLHESSLSALQQLSEADSPVETDEELEDWLSRVERAKNEPFTVPEQLTAELRDYQLEGYRWLRALSELGLGACLADDMGLGKTVQIIALLIARAETGPALVVAPTSVCANWLSELKRFAPSLKAVDYSGRSRDKILKQLSQGSVFVTSYGLLQQDSEALTEIEWGSVVVDEAQFIKNARTHRARAAHALIAGYRVAATGTPVENHLGDLWSIFRFANPELLGGFQAFSRKYMKPIERDSDSGVRRELGDLVRPYVLRRRKQEVLKDLPPVTTVQHQVMLSEADTARYAQLRQQIRGRFEQASRQKGPGNRIEILAEITRLRRFCCHPRLVFPDAPSQSAKIDTLLELLTELRLNGHRALVFSQFVDFLALVRERLDEQGFTYQYLDGQTPAKARQVRVNEFQAGKGDLFLISLKAGGFGVNLTEADYVIHLDPWWNPAVESQATDRAHRIGQTRPVTVYRLVTKDTIEESIVKLHEDKRELAESLFQDGDRKVKLSVSELLGLIGR